MEREFRVFTQINREVFLVGTICTRNSDVDAANNSNLPRMQWLAENGITKDNNLKIYDYFKLLLEEILKHMDDTNMDFIDELLPKSPEVQSQCRKTDKREESQLENHCKVIAITNQKGGVVKTTTTVNLGVGLANEGKLRLAFVIDSNVIKKSYATFAMSFIETPLWRSVEKHDIINSLVLFCKTLVSNHQLCGISHFASCTIGTQQNRMQSQLKEERIWIRKR